SAAPAAWRPAVIAPSPNASSAIGPKRAVRASRALRRANHLASPSVSGRPSAPRRARQLASASRAMRISAGRRSTAAPGSAPAPARLLARPEVACRHVDERRAERRGRAAQREEIVVRAAVEELRIRDRAGRDDAHDLAPHQLLAPAGHFHLFADRHLLTRADEP